MHAGEGGGPTSGGHDAWMSGSHSSGLGIDLLLREVSQRTQALPQDLMQMSRLPQRRQYQSAIPSARAAYGSEQPYRSSTGSGPSRSPRDNLDL